MSDENFKSTPVINERRDEVCLGELTFQYDPTCNLLQVVKHGEEVFIAGEGMYPDLWESFVSALEAKIACGPMLSALRQIRTLGEDPSLRGNNTEAMAQLGQKALGIAEQVLDEFERTSEPKEDTRHISMLESASAPRGIVPPEVMLGLGLESESIGAPVEVLNWQTTSIDGLQVLFMLYHYKGESHVIEERPEGFRCAVHVGDKVMLSDAVEIEE